MKGFKEFILRGNVVDLAVAVVVGAAFTAIVTALVTDVIDPIIGVVFNASDLNKALIVRIPAIAGGSSGKLLIGAFIASAAAAYAGQLRDAHADLADPA